VALALVLMSTVVSPASLSAQAPVAAAHVDARASARTAALAGLAAIDAKDYALAVLRFEEAERHFHAPTHLLYLARAKAQLGQVPDAIMVYERLLAEPLAADAPKAFVEAKAVAEAELAVLVAPMPKLTVVVRGASVERVRITLDGTRALRSERSAGVAVGTHTVVVEAAGMRKETRTIDLGSREERALVVELVPESAEEGRAPGPVSPVTWATFGVAGLALVVGSSTGVASLDKVDALDTRCPSRRDCLPTDRDLAADARALGTASTVSFVVGGLAAAAGVTLLVFDLQGKPVFGSESPGGASSARLRAGPGWLGLDGRF
jgi:hypothetical protein